MLDDFKPVKVSKKIAKDDVPKISGEQPDSVTSEAEGNEVKTSRKPLKLLAGPRRIHWWLKKLTRKQLIILAVVALMLVAGVAIGARAILNKNLATEPQNSFEPPPKPTTIASRMTGVEIPIELNELPVTGVMIENSPDARPQAGLSQADMVFEAIAEGGITRFLALYQESQPERIGPVRSVRPYYLDYLAPYDGAIVHAGGSGEALAQIKSQGIKDIDHGANGSTFERASNRFAPHNLYTSRAKLLEAHNRRGYTSSTYTGFARKKADTPAETPTARSADLVISSALYNVRFDYDQPSNSYLRSVGGKPHVDEVSGAQIKPKVVVAMVVSHSYAGIYSQYGVNGSGEAYVFQDGIFVKGTWHKANRKDQIVLKDGNGEVLPLNPGQTWVTLVAGSDRVKIAP